jgi:hypothetical protein
LLLLTVINVRKIHSHFKELACEIAEKEDFSAHTALLPAHKGRVLSSIPPDIDNGEREK